MSLADPLKLVGAAVRAERERQELSQEQLGERADLHRNEIGVIERGEVNTSLINFFRVCKALGKAPAELLSGITVTKLKLPPKRSYSRSEK